MLKTYIVNGEEDRRVFLPKEKMVWLLRQIADGVEEGTLDYGNSYWFWEEEDSRLLRATLDGEIYSET